MSGVSLLRNKTMDNAGTNVVAAIKIAMGIIAKVAMDATDTF